MPDRTYEQTHSWLKFRLDDINESTALFWMLLGEARSKCEHIKYVPLSPDTAGQLNAVYFAKGVNATTAIEGNTLTEQQVESRIAGQLELPISKEYLGVEIDNVVGAYNHMVGAVIAGDAIPLNHDTLCRLNKEILAGLMVEDHVVPGELRRCSVAAGPYLAPPWQEVAYLVDKMCDWLDTITPPDPQLALPFAFIKAVVAHVYIEWIHPFGDGNGRLGRLAEFLILISSGVPLPAAHILTSHYNDTRTEYYRQLNLSSRNGGDLRPFLQYAAQGFVDGLTEAIKHLHRQQEQLMWRALVDSNFEDRRTTAAHRQRELAIHLAAQSGGGIFKGAIRDLIPAYVGHTKMLTRDINRLKNMELVQVSGSTLEANLFLVRGMRPLVVGGE
jgi:Fic family protein